MLKTIYEQNGRRIAVFHPDTSRHVVAPTTPRTIRPQGESAARARNLLKRKLYLNPQLDTFITLTYRKQNATPRMILDDLKNCFSRKHRQYVAVIEKHKSGNLHVHAIVNWDECNFIMNEHKHYTFPDWTKGFSNVQKIKKIDKDKNSVAVALYMSKYVTKSSDMIAGRYFLSSQGLLKNQQKTVQFYPDEIFHSKNFAQFLHNNEPGCNFYIHKNGQFSVGVCYNNLTSIKVKGKE